MARVISLAFVAFTIVACAYSNPVSPGYPCGPRGLPCSNHMCCWQGDTCGGDDPTCPAGMCCWVGPDDPTSDGAIHRQRPQFSPTTH